MLYYDTYKDWIDYVDYEIPVPENTPDYERPLVKDAPESAIRALASYVKIMRDAQKYGIDF